MFCENCGTKAKEGANFCEECGTPLKKRKPNKVTKQIKKVIKKPKKEIPKKTKIIIGIVLALVILATISLLIVSNSVKPQTVVAEYFDALKDTDVDKIYSYLDVQDKDFTSKEAFENLLTANSDQIVNYSITNTTISTDGLEAKVTVKYITEEDDSDSVTINLIKESDNKLLFFSNWKIEPDFEIVNDYQIKVIKDSEVELAGIALTEDYLDAEESDDEFDVYVIPELFKTEYPVKVTYPMGITIESTLNTDSFINSKTLSFSLNDISEEDQTKIEKAVIENIQYIYDSALANKDYDSIKEKFYSNDDLEEAYDNFKTRLENRSDDLDSITFTDVKINRIYLDDDGYLNVSFKINYEYKTDSTSQEDSVYSSISFVYDDEYKVAYFTKFKTNF